MDPMTLMSIFNALSGIGKKGADNSKMLDVNNAVEIIKSIMSQSNDKQQMTNLDNQLSGVKTNEVDATKNDIAEQAKKYFAETYNGAPAPKEFYDMTDPKVQADYYRQLQQASVIRESKSNPWNDLFGKKIKAENKRFQNDMNTWKEKYDKSVLVAKNDMGDRQKETYLSNRYSFANGGKVKDNTSQSDSTSQDNNIPQNIPQNITEWQFQQARDYIDQYGFNSPEVINKIKDNPGFIATAFSAYLKNGKATPETKKLLEVYNSVFKMKYDTNANTLRPIQDIPKWHKEPVFVNPPGSDINDHAWMKVMNKQPITENKKDGGKITGEGTSKSDSISAKLDVGDFVIPADAPKEVVNDLMKYIGETGNASKSDGTNDVNLSNGEYKIPKEKLFKANMYLKSQGFSNGLYDLAPNAADNIGNQMSKGGTNDPLFNMFMQSTEIVDAANKLKENGLSESDIADFFGGMYKKNTSEKGQTWDKLLKGGKKVLSFIKDNKEFLPGLAQFAIGAKQSKDLGDRPVLGVSPELLSMKGIVAGDTSGLDERIKLEYNKNVERQRRQSIKEVIDKSGGSPSQTMQGIATANIISNDALTKTLGLDQQYKERKKDRLLNISSAIADQQFKSQMSGIDAYDRNQEAVAKLISSGIENMAGASRYKNIVEALKNQNK